MYFIAAIHAQKKAATVNKTEMISLSGLLTAYYNISTLPKWLSNTTVAQVSTYDTTGGNNDGFNGTYSFIRKDKDSNLVIFDVKGAGEINRIWTPTPTEDTLDFYIDDSLHPAFSIKYSDLFNDKVYPFLSPLCGNELGGYYCYLPIPFQKSCKIICRARQTKFHQIQYRLYPEGTVVKPFSIDLNKEEKAGLQKIATLWKNKERGVNDFYANSGEIITEEKQFVLQPGGAVTIFNAKRGGRILEIALNNASLLEGLQKQVDIKITWDDESIPAVYCPVADFFGYAFGKTSMQALLLGTINNKTYCFLPMPFDKAAKIELLYRKSDLASNKQLQLSATIRYSNKKRNAETEGKLYTHWNSNNLAAYEPAHVFLNTQARGHYIGTVLLAQGMKPGMTYFFEGDDSTATDNIFRIHGTGSEDYFNGGWYALADRWDRKLSLPLHGSLDYSLPFCRTAGYRFYMGDKLSFEKNIYKSIEHGPEANNMGVDYTSLAFYYADKPPVSFLKPVNQLTNVYNPDTLIIYPQLMRYMLIENIAAKAAWTNYNTGGQSFTFTASNESGLNILLDEIPDGSYKLYTDFTKLETGCAVSFWQGQQPVADWIDTYGKEERVPMQYTGTISIGEFNRSLSIHFKTDANKNKFLISRLVLVRQQ